MTQMEKNYELMKHPSLGLKDSVDSLRTSIKDLYELDEDNYQMIRNLQKALDISNNRINKLTRRFNTLCRLTGLGLILTGIGGMIINSIVEEHAKRIECLEAKQRAQKEESEESDG